MKEDFEDNPPGPDNSALYIGLSVAGAIFILIVLLAIFGPRFNKFHSENGYYWYKGTTKVE
jgi:hypothetical protein